MRLMLAVLLAAQVRAAPAPKTSCEALKSYARKLSEAHPASTPNPVNCAPGVDAGSSNYILPTDDSAPYEMHVVSVRQGSRPLEEGDDSARRLVGAIQVAIYRTRKPAVLVLSAQEPVKWDVKLTQESNVAYVVLQGPEPLLRGVPRRIPVLRRGPEESCGLAYAWEPQPQRAAHALMVESLRCFTGLRETSFQGCYGGLFFEVPHYRQDAPELYAAQGAPQACPLPAVPGAKIFELARLSVDESSRQGASAAPSPSVPVRPDPRSGINPNLERPGPVGAAQGLPAPRGLPARGDIPARALAILLDGDRTLLTHDAIPDLIEALEKGDLLLRSRAADELGKMGPPAKAAIPALIRALQDPHDRLRAGAALALGNIGPASEGALKLLESCLDDDNAEVRLSAELALERIGTKKALKALERHRHSKLK